MFNKNYNVNNKIYNFAVKHYLLLIIQEGCNPYSIIQYLNLLTEIIDLSNNNRIQTNLVLKALMQFLIKLKYLKVK